MKRKDDTDLDDGLASLLTGDIDGEVYEEHAATGFPYVGEGGEQAGTFDLAAYLDKLRATVGVLINHQAIEVPLDAILEAQMACVLFGLELAVDDAGNPYLIEAVVADDEQVVVVSRSFAEVESEEDSLEITTDDLGGYFLMAMLRVAEHRAVMVSETFAPNPIPGEGEGGNEEEVAPESGQGGS